MFQERARLRIVLVAGAAALSGIILLLMAARYRRLNGELASLKATQTRIFLENQDLEDDLEYVKSDAFIEREARDRYGLIRPGEIRYALQR